MARNKELNQRMKEERLERILMGALELFALNGLDGTKISDIARHTEMSNGLIYHYFKAKEDIFTALIERAFKRMVTACRHLQGLEVEPHEKIRYALDQLVTTIRTTPGACLYHLLIAQATASHNVPEQSKEIIERYRHIPHTVIADIIVEGQKQGTIRQGRAEDLAFFFWVNINGLALHQVMYGEHARAPRLTPLYSMFFEQEEHKNDV